MHNLLPPVVAAVAAAVVVVDVVVTLMLVNPTFTLTSAKPLPRSLMRNRKFGLKLKRNFFFSV
jgi:hypothetical protein